MARKDREHVDRSTEHGDRGLYEMRAGLSSHDDSDRGAEDHDRGIRGWWSRHFSPDDPRGHGEGHGSHEPTHRSWFGGDDYGDTGRQRREHRRDDERLLAERHLAERHNDHIAGSRGRLGRNEYTSRDDERSQFMRGGVDMRDSSLRDHSGDHDMGSNFDARNRHDYDARSFVPPHRHGSDPRSRHSHDARSGHDMREREMRDRQMRDREMRDREMRDREIRDREMRDREMRDREMRMSSGRGMGEMRPRSEMRSARDVRDIPGGGYDLPRYRDSNPRGDHRAELSRDDIRSAPQGYSRSGHDEHGWATEGFRDTTSRGGFGGRGQFDRLRDQNGNPIDERGDHRHYYGGGADTASRSQWRSGSGDIHARQYTDEDEDDRRLRGYRGDVDSRSRQFIGDQHDDDDMRGQFHRSRNDGELGRRGSVGEARFNSDPRRHPHDHHHVDQRDRYDYQHPQATQMNRDDRGQRTEWYGNEDRAGSNWRGGGMSEMDQRGDHSQQRGFRPIEDMRDMHGSGGTGSAQQQHGRQYDRGGTGASGDTRRTDEWSPDVRRTSTSDHNDGMTSATGDESHHIPRGASSIDSPSQGAPNASSNVSSNGATGKPGRDTTRH